MVNDPTRIASGNILDLVLTSNPSIIINTHTTPGMSDHESVTFNVKLNPVRNRTHSTKVIVTNQHTGPQLTGYRHKLDLFRERLTLININIPRRYTKAKTHLPWITRELIKMQRRRNKRHKKAKQIGLNSDWEKFKELQKQATKALAKSYKDYVNNHIGNSLKTNPKFIKANKRENILHSHSSSKCQPIINDRDKTNALNNQLSSVFTQQHCWTLDKPMASLSTCHLGLWLV